MRARSLSIIVGLVLILAVATPVAADTGPGDLSDLGLDSIAVVAGSGGKTATVTVSIECSQDVIGSGWVYMHQSVGRFHSVDGDGYFDFECVAVEGSVTVTVPIYVYQGWFSGGRATVDAYAETSGECVYDPEFDEEICEYDAVATTQAIRLRGH